MKGKHHQQKKREKREQKAKRRRKDAMEARRREAVLRRREGKALALAKKAGRTPHRDALKFVISDRHAYRRFIASCKSASAANAVSGTAHNVFNKEAKAA
ncbi:MAG: hypothetical protein AAGK74_00680 [Chloroflexota bacterium]